MTNEIRLALAKDLVLALEQGEEEVADDLLNKIVDVRESQLYQEVGRLTRQLHDTMTGFTVDSNITALTENDIPDAKERLHYVITMTEQAANETMDAVESLLPVSQALNEQSQRLSGKWSRFLVKEMPFDEFKNMSAEITLHFQESKASLQQINDGLNQILMAQGFQDITGQIIKRVIDLVGNLEASMVELIQLSGGKSDTNEQTGTEADLPGPVVPGVDDKKGDVAASQDDVDDLLSSLGF